MADMPNSEDAPTTTKMTKTEIKALAKDHILDKIACAVSYAEEMLASTGEPFSPEIQAEIRKQGNIAARALGFTEVPIA